MYGTRMHGTGIPTDLMDPRNENSLPLARSISVGRAMDPRNPLSTTASDKPIHYDTEYGFSGSKVPPQRVYTPPVRSGSAFSPKDVKKDTGSPFGWLFKCISPDIYEKDPPPKLNLQIPLAADKANKNHTKGPLPPAPEQPIGPPTPGGVWEAWYQVKETGEDEGWFKIREMNDPKERSMRPAKDFATWEEIIKNCKYGSPWIDDDCPDVDPYIAGEDLERFEWVDPSTIWKDQNVALFKAPPGSTDPMDPNDINQGIEC